MDEIYEVLSVLYLSGMLVCHFFSYLVLQPFQSYIMGMKLCETDITWYLLHPLLPFFAKGTFFYWFLFASLVYTYIIYIYNHISIVGD